MIHVVAAVPKVSVCGCRSNAEQIAGIVSTAVGNGAEVIVCPELCISGYTCGDMFLNPCLSESAEEALRFITSENEAECLVVGMPFREFHRIYNIAVVISHHRIIGAVPKMKPSREFGLDQRRWFSPGKEIDGREITLCGETVRCSSSSRFSVGQASIAVGFGFDVRHDGSINLLLHAVPESYGLGRRMKARIAEISARHTCVLAIASPGTGESTSDFVFGGEAYIADCGQILCSSTRFSRSSETIEAEIDLTIDRTPVPCEKERKADIKFSATPCVPESDEEMEDIFEIQKSGLAKRLTHTRCQNLVLGVSGGLDSTLALMVAVATFDMLGLDRRGIHAVTMPGFGTTGRTHSNALTLMRELGVGQCEVSICKAVRQHFRDIGIDENDRSAAYENSQARERTQILMDLANKVGGMVLGTGDLSEASLGWETYNGDHMSMYNVNCSLPKTLVKAMVGWIARNTEAEPVRNALEDIIATPVSPELLPANEDGEIVQKTEEKVGPYILHDFFIYHMLHLHESPRFVLENAVSVFEGKFDQETIRTWLKVFIIRFFSQQYKRSASPDGPQVGVLSLSPRGGLCMPSDAVADDFLREIG